MPSMRTMFRALVMIAIGAALFKGWQMYGPPAEQVKSIAVRATDFAQAAWKNFQGKDHEAAPSAEVRGRTPPLAVAQQPLGDIAIVPPALSTQTLTPSPPTGAIPSASGPTTQTAITPLTDSAPATGSADDRVKTLMSRLEQLGGTDSKLSPWGSSGHLFRCYCRAPLPNAPAVMQHFESVAAEPALAVEQVMAKLEASRTAKRNGAVLRY
jgi:hypothetical protein